MKLVGALKHIGLGLGMPRTIPAEQLLLGDSYHFLAVFGWF